MLHWLQKFCIHHEGLEDNEIDLYRAPDTCKFPIAVSRKNFAFSILSSKNFHGREIGRRYSGWGERTISSNNANYVMSLSGTDCCDIKFKSRCPMGSIIGNNVVRNRFSNAKIRVVERNTSCHQCLIIDFYPRQQ